jgi:hypothetical protein
LFRVGGHGVEIKIVFLREITRRVKNGEVIPAEPGPAVAGK